MREYTCTCIGGWGEPGKAEMAALRIQMEKLIEDKGVRHFLCGMERGLELCFGELAARLRDSKYPFITLESVIPFEEQAAAWAEVDRDRYYTLAAGCDRENMLNRRYTEGCMIQRDSYLLKNARYLIVKKDEGLSTLRLDITDI